MVSFIAVPSANFMAFHHQPISYLNNPSIFSVVSVINPPKLDHPLRSKTKQLKHRKQNQNQNQMLFEFSGFSGVVMMCKNWEGESDPNLELQVLEFMKNSKNPKKFPSKKEMIDCGKSDLVEEIMKRGGWMTVGWEDDDEENYDEKVICESGLNKDFDVLLEKNGKNNDVVEVEEKSGSYYKEERHFNGQSSFLNNSSSTASSSGRPLELVTKDEGGIEGILHRLERQRDRNFGYKLGKNGAMEFVGGELRENGRSKGDSCHPQRIERASFNHDIPLITGDGLKKLCSNGFSRSLKSDAWRTWSIQRAGCSDSDFEAGEIDFGENTNQGIVDKSKGEIFAISMEGRRAQDDTKDLDFSHREITQGDLRTRLQHLEVELSSVLHSLRSNTSDLPGKEKEHLSEEWRKLSDVSEFQENEMMNAQDKLRTLRAKLAVLEGKMSLAIMDAQYVLDEKQKRINDARRALQLLRTTCIVWPNHGSEVLLAGSFDGWATQRKMTKSSTGIFSLCLKLYPGKYEIKFIVDGVWKVDPLRPIVNNNGFENNLLTIT